ncbi:CAP domain-containing protein [uncultured Litoreibacter sp.]|uniref:CAP domain-containing protein n=1 Tax=uncultured Litoreibacter sp. TaxID=1392394 RepID=UPI00261FF36C|nr:CAP domain-containing protein [uncultured Litoreibacter sp.]
MTTASTFERQMLDLINQERTSRGLDPVQLELRLNSSAEEHSEWMLQRDVFSHTGVGGSSAGDRMASAGFTFSGNWSWAENIAWQSERGAPGLADDVVDLHNSLMNSPGHRANILNPNMTVVGIGIERGNFNGTDAVMVTQNFARTSAPLQLDTGGTGPTAGADTLTLSAAGTLNGLAGNDVLTGSAGNDALFGDAGFDVLRGGAGNDRLVGGAHADTLYGGGGNDTLNGGNGFDRLFGGAGDDQLIDLSGPGGQFGGAGNDTMRGGDDGTVFFGGPGNDVIIGGGGNDRISGNAGFDRIDGGTGNDLMLGNYNADTFVFADGHGVDRVGDFDALNPFEKLDLSAVNGLSLAGLNLGSATQGAARQVGGDVVIETGGGNSITLDGVNLSDLDSTDFIF